MQDPDGGEGRAPRRRGAGPPGGDGPDGATDGLPDGLTDAATDAEAEEGRDAGARADAAQQGRRRSAAEAWHPGGALEHLLRRRAGQAAAARAGVAAPAPGPAGWLAARVREDLETGRGLPWASLAFVAGIALYFALPSEPSAPALCALAAAALLWHRARRRGGGAAGLSLAVALCLAGLAAGALRGAVVAAPVLERPRSVLIEGHVEAVERREGGLRLTLRVVSAERLAPAATPHRVRITLRGRLAEPAPRPGAAVRLRARLVPPAGAIMPGGYDFAFRAYFARIGATGFAVSAPEPASLGPPPVGLRLTTALDRLRQAIAGRIGAALGADSIAGALAVALIVGDRAGIPEPVNEVLRTSGLAHILAISGLHMALFSGAVFLAVRAALALSPRLADTRPIDRWAAAAALVAATFYLAISGGAVSAQRAYVMTALVLIGRMAGRRALTLRNTAVAALIILAVAPESLLDPGFQMSFAAVVALVAGYEELRRRRAGSAGSDLAGAGAAEAGREEHGRAEAGSVGLVALRPVWLRLDRLGRGLFGGGRPDADRLDVGRIGARRFDGAGAGAFASGPVGLAMIAAGRWMGAILLTSIIAGLATGAIGAFHFHRIAPLGPLANLAAMPLVSLLVMPAAVFALLLMPLGLEIVPLAVMGAALDMVVAVAAWTDANTPGDGVIGAPSLWATLLVVAAGACLCLAPRGTRAVAVVPLVAALVAQGLHRQPDLLVSSDGAAIAFRDATGSLRVTARAGSFLAESWLRAEGLGEAERAGRAVPRAALDCDPSGCVVAAHAPDGPAPAPSAGRHPAEPVAQPPPSAPTLHPTRDPPPSAAAPTTTPAPESDPALALSAAAPTMTPAPELDPAVDPAVDPPRSVGAPAKALAPESDPALAPPQPAGAPAKALHPTLDPALAPALSAAVTTMTLAPELDPALAPALSAGAPAKALAPESDPAVDPPRSAGAPALLVALARTPEALAEDCRRADVLVTPWRAPADCAARIVLDGPRLARQGATAFWFSSGPPTPDTPPDTPTAPPNPALADATGATAAQAGAGIALRTRPAYRWVRPWTPRQGASNKD